MKKKQQETTLHEMNQFLSRLLFSEVKDEKALGFQDLFVTEEQKKRDAEITKLLAEYVGFYKKKVRHSTICRYIILIPCMLIVSSFAFILVFFALKIINSQSNVQPTGVAAFITACISFISLIIGLLTIITKYFFPENDEQYITNIVESIQKNDLENKRENAKNQKNGSTDQG